MIFGRSKNKDTTKTPESAAPAAPVTPPPATASAPASPAPTTPTSPAPAAAKPAPNAPAAPTAAPTAESTAPVSAQERELRARRALGAKMITASFGEIVSILMRSSAYKHFSLSDLEWLVIPPVLTQQFVLAEACKGEGGIPSPIAVALWASVSQEVDEKLTANTTGPLRLRPDEWKSGEILWLIDAVGPSQVLKGLIDNLHQNVFKGRPLKVRSRDEDGKPVIKVQRLPVTGEAVS